jgi:hypothetical protein
VDVAKEYVQDTFLLEIIHALGRREPGRHVRTRESILKDKKLIAPETLRKVSESVKDSLGDDALGRHFLAALDDKSPAPWNPSAIRKPMLVRQQSLRKMADNAPEKN